MKTKGLLIWIYLIGFSFSACHEKCITCDDSANGICSACAEGYFLENPSNCSRINFL